MDGDGVAGVVFHGGCSTSTRIGGVGVGAGVTVDAGDGVLTSSVDSFVSWGSRGIVEVSITSGASTRSSGDPGLSWSGGGGGGGRTAPCVPS